MKLFEEMDARVRSKIQAFEMKIKDRSRDIEIRSREADKKLQEALREARQTSGVWPPLGTAATFSWGTSVVPNITHFGGSYNPGYHNSRHLHT